MRVQKKIWIFVVVLILFFLLLQLYVHPFGTAEKVSEAQTGPSKKETFGVKVPHDIHTHKPEKKEIKPIIQQEKPKLIEKQQQKEELSSTTSQVEKEALEDLGEGGIVIMTCCRPEVYQETLNSLSEVREKGNFTIIASHDFYDEDVVRVTDNIKDWKRVIRVINPYRYLYDEFFDRLTFLQYGTKALKCHWAWAMKFSFDVLKLPYVIYLEDDFVVSPDVLITFRELLKNARRLCLSEDDDATKGMICGMNLGCRGDCYQSKTLSDFDKVVFFPGFGNTGSVFFQEHWNSIKKNINEYCGNVEDNWDITMEHLTAKNVLPRDVLTLSYSRVLDMKNVVSARTSDDGSQNGAIPPSEVRAKMSSRWIRDGMRRHEVKDLSKLKKMDVRRVGPNWKKKKSMFRMCKRRFTDLCNLMGTDERLKVLGWEKVSENVYAPTGFDLSHVDKTSIEHERDYCWKEDAFNYTTSEMKKKKKKDEMGIIEF